MEGFGQFMPIILLFLAMYFLFILPQSKKAKKEKNFIKNVKILNVFEYPKSLR